MTAEGWRVGTVRTVRHIDNQEHCTVTFSSRPVSLLPSSPLSPKYIILENLRETQCYSVIFNIFNPTYWTMCEI